LMFLYLVPLLRQGCHILSYDFTSLSASCISRINIEAPRTRSRVKTRRI
jgi:hypothetical protein